MKNPKRSLLSYELQLYKELYLNEEEYRHKCSDRVFKSVTIMIAIIPAYLWLILKFIYILNNISKFIKVIGVISLITNGTLLIACAVIFFLILYGYNDSRIDPTELKNIINRYKTQSPSRDGIIDALDKSLLMSYKELFENSYNENVKHMKKFTYFFVFLLITIGSLIVSFFIEMVLPLIV